MRPEDAASALSISAGARLGYTAARHLKLHFALSGKAPPFPAGNWYRGSSATRLNTFITALWPERRIFLLAVVREQSEVPMIESSPSLVREAPAAVRPK